MTTSDRSPQSAAASRSTDPPALLRDARTLSPHLSPVRTHYSAALILLAVSARPDPLRQ